MVHDQQFPGPHGRNAPRYAPAGARRSKHPCLKCYCWCCFVLFILLLIFACVVAGGWAILNPSLPKYIISGLSSSAFNFTNDYKFHGRFVVTVGANNPNKYIRVVYGKDSTVDLLFTDESNPGQKTNFVKLCSGKIPEFNQPTNNVTVMQIDLKGDLTKADFGSSANVFNETVGKGKRIPLVVSIKAHGQVIFLGKEVKVEVGANCSMDVNTLSAGKEIKLSNVAYASTTLKYFIS